MPTFVRIPFIAALLAGGTHGVAWACSCMPWTADADETLAMYDTAVVGEVVSVGGGVTGCRTNTADPLPVRLVVTEAFKGAEVGEELRIETPRSSASCGIHFQVGEEWLVFEKEDEIVGLCGPTRLADPDDPLLVELREGADAVPGGEPDEL